VTRTHAQVPISASDVGSHRGAERFVQTLRRYVAGEPLENVIDRKCGY